MKLLDEKRVKKLMYKKFYQFNFKKLLKLRLHLGHKDECLDLNLTSYIYGTRYNISIYNLEKLWKPYRYLYYGLVRNFSRRNCFFIVGTNPNLPMGAILKNIFQYHPEKFKFNKAYYVSGYVDKKWIGGLFTNWKIFKEFVLLLDTPLINFKKQFKYFKYFKYLKGVKNLTYLPTPDFVIILNKDQDALTELNNFNIPLIGFIDTNMKPQDFVFKFFGNNDSIKNIDFFFKFLKQAIFEGRLKEQKKFCTIFLSQIKKKLKNEV